MSLNNKPIISINNLSVQYKRSSTYALKDISFKQYQGEKILLMGRTGAGKSTFCYCLKGIIPYIIPASLNGNIIIKNQKIASPEITIGLVLQEFESQIFNSTIELEIAFGLQNLGLKREKIKEIIQHSLEKFNLISYAKKSPYYISGGQKQRLAIASIWAMKPEVFILDEPLTDLDTEARKILFSLITELEEEKTSIILTDNNLENASFFDKAIIMNKGSIIIEDKTNNILKDSPKYIEYGMRPPTHISLLNDLGLPYQEGLTLEKTVNLIKKSINFPTSLTPQEKTSEISGENIIIFDNVSFQYPNSNYGIFNINLEIKKGDFVGLIGTNGSGKTTLLKLMTGILCPNKGKVYLKNNQPHKIPAKAIPQIIGYVLQNPDHQLFTNSIKEELLYCMKKSNKFYNNFDEKIIQILKTIHMEGLENSDPFLLTKGERQKIAVATALINEPEIIILDEPSTGLDYKEQLSLMQLLQELHKNGKTIIITTHSLWIIEEYAEKCIILKDGKIIASSYVSTLLSCLDNFLKANLSPPELSIICNKLNLPFLTYNNLIRYLRRFI